jgi:hypothetical protein
MRWSEEAELLLEEMHRVLVYLSWEADWWRERVHGCALSMSAEELEGAVAYAEWQPAIWTKLCDHFKHLWCFVPVYIAMGLGEVLEEEGKIRTIEDEDE